MAVSSLRFIVTSASIAVDAPVLCQDACTEAMGDIATSSDTSFTAVPDGIDAPVTVIGTSKGSPTGPTPPVRRAAAAGAGSGVGTTVTAGMTVVCVR